VRYTFLTDDDSQAENFSRTERLLAIHLAKAAEVFGE